jgi:hypothetical protein
MNIEKLVEKYRLYDFSNKDLNLLYKEIEKNFINEVISNNSNQLNINSFRNIITKTIEELIQIQLISRNKVPIDIIWKTLYRRKIVIWVINFFSASYDDSFLKLEYYFDLKYKNEIKINNDGISEYMSFMGLKPGFTKTELTKRYRQLCLLYHPDKGGNSQMFIKLQKSKEILGKIL